MHETGYSGLVHWDDPEGWDGEGGGRGDQDGGHMYTHVTLFPAPLPYQINLHVHRTAPNVAIYRMESGCHLHTEMKCP